MELGKTFWFGAKWTAGVILAIWIGMPGAFKLLLICQILDVVSGLLAANNRHELRSALAWRGIRNKVLTWIVVLLVYQLQVQAVGAVLSDTQVPGPMLAGFAAIGFAGAEAMSIVENALRSGLKIPTFLVTGLAMVHDKVFGDE
ncbi:hypothetical protein LCGC14_0386920 [marine sediment metagenome]|uniref:Holin n=1 Tax=marine sediment metagenome TaxID=412755 RepID=A0A0F9T6I4_9ZZZZ